MVHKLVWWILKLKTLQGGHRLNDAGQHETANRHDSESFSEFLALFFCHRVMIILLSNN